MSRPGWQALILIPLLLSIYGLWRALRARPGGQLLAPRTRFLLLSVLAHVGLLFALDLVLISIPVVEAHKDAIGAAIVKTFALFPTTSRGGSSPSWERLPDGPPPPAPPVEPPGSRASSPGSVPFDPALKGIAPTIPEALARTLPPERVLFLPRKNPETPDAPPTDLPRAETVVPDLPRVDPPALARVDPPAETRPEAPSTPVDRQAADPRPPGPAMSAIGEPRFSVNPPDPIRLTEIEPTTSRIPIPDLPRRPVETPYTLPEVTVPAVAAVPEAPVRPVVEASAPLPRASLKDVEPVKSPPTLALARVSPPLRTIDPPREMPLPRLDVPPPSLPPMRLPSAELPTASLTLPVEPPDLMSSFSLRAPEVRKELVGALGGSEASEAAVGRGLTWLVAHQGSAGNWAFDDLHCQGHRCDAAGNSRADAGATGLALMALLGAGNSPTKGPHAASVRRGVDWLVSKQHPDGCLSEPGGTQMYAHGFAAIALCEAFGLSADPALRGPAERAVRFIVDAQDPESGGWRYSPRGGGDTSVFGWQVMALKSAEMAGLTVPAATYRRASRWLDSVAVAPRRELYGYQPGREATPSMTAEALLCRQYLGGGTAPGRSMAAGGLYLRKNLPRWDARHLYYWYYATQVMYHLRGDDWSSWNGTLRDMLVSSQEKDGPSSGSWHPSRPSQDMRGEQGGRVYETALSLLILEVYYRHLPLYQQLSSGGTADVR